jgi:murein DD-endopeptidase MepM/ murein hydrolase activator NlpD
MIPTNQLLEKSKRPVSTLLFSFSVFIMFLLSLSSCSTYTAPKQGTWHTLAPGETLEVISKRYSVPISDLIAANDIYDPDDLAPGNQLYIPTPARIKKEPEKTKARSAPKVTSKPISIPKKKHSKIRFIWPSKGTISSGFGLRHGRMHEGIDITKDRGRDIRAAAAGVVEFAGNRNGYGKTIIINHGSGYKTLYGHNQRLYVRKGVRVRSGALIARMGSSGRSTGIHLHFEVRYKGKPKNPLRFLPVR